MTAAQRLAALDALPAQELVANAETALHTFVDIMNRETTLLRAGHSREAAALGSEKTRLAEHYVGFARAIQRQFTRLLAEAPVDVDRLRLGHEQLATQMAENLKVIATFRDVADHLVTDLARRIERTGQPQAYDAAGAIAPAKPGGRGLSINRAT